MTAFHGEGAGMDYQRAISHNPVRVIFVDDHPVVRCGFEKRIGRETDMRVVGSYSNSRELMIALRRHQCDVLVLDYLLRLDDIDGALLIRYVKILHPEVRVLVSSSYINGPTVGACLKAGALGFCCKSARLDELIGAIRRVAGNELYLDGPAGMALAAAGAVAACSPLRAAELTLKELEVLRCCLHGLSVTRIAAKFHRSVKTVSGHKVAAYRKLGIDSDAQLFRIRPQLEGL